jgi:hypothetical protein
MKSKDLSYIGLHHITVVLMIRMVKMIRISLLVLLVVGISGIMVIGSTLNSMPILPVYSTPAQESSGEAGGQQDEATNEPTEDEPTIDQPVDDEPETVPEAPVAEPVDEEQLEQEQLALDIISSNGLVVVNETASTVDGDGGGGTGDDVGAAAEKETTCVTNAKGEVFCYETLPTIENCLKPMVEEDPPLCLKGS